MPEETPTVVQPETTQPNVPEVPQVDNKAPKRSLGDKLKSKKVLLSAFIVVVLLAVGGWYLFIRKDSTPTATTASTKQQVKDINSADELKDAINEVNSLKQQDEERLKKLDTYTQ
jgi:uncharacterized protein HemX